MKMYRAVSALIVIGLVLVEEGSSHQDSRNGRQDGIIYIDGGREPAAPFPSSCRRYRGRLDFGGEVCAKNGITYPNYLFLNCINRHQQRNNRIEMDYSGPCRAEGDPNAACEKNMLYQPVCGSDNETYANIEALNCKNAMVPGYDVRMVKEGECAHIRCPCRRIDPTKVCASNGLTYGSVGEVRCLRRFNSGLHILHSGGCTVREVRRSQGRRFACHLARNRYEWNPVCGKNNLTYANPYVYMCHHPPGEGKCAAKPGECGTLKQLACSRADSINHRQLQASALVCGSNGVTYRSYEHLHCATANDRYLEAVSTGKCTKAYDPCQLTLKPLIGRGQPVCGTDNKSYSSIQALWCVKHLDKKDLKFKHDGPCL